jgi:small-conductance mechanosensitive channel
MKERSAQLGPTLRDARQLQDFLELWKREIEVRIGDQGTAEQTRAWGDGVLDQLKGFWSYEILAVEDTLTVNGEKIVEKRPVTVGKMIEAALILAIGLLAASGLARLLSRIVSPFSARGWQRRLLMQKILRVAMIALVVVLALITVKIPLTVFAFLGGAIALGIGFGAKNLLNNFISGFILLGEGTIRPGDRIEIEGNLGIVQRIGERSTQVRRLDGVELLIPNSHFLENLVTNLTLSDRRLRVAIQVGVAYGSPTREVQALLLEIARANPLVVAMPAPVAVFEDFGDSALVFRLYVWVDLAAQPDHRAVITELRHSIAERFAEAGFAIAFPQMDVHFDTKGPIPVRVSQGDGEGAASG